jgi:hypothetical protein
MQKLGVNVTSRLPTENIKKDIKKCMRCPEQCVPWGDLSSLTCDRLQLSEYEIHMYRWEGHWPGTRRCAQMGGPLVFALVKV